MNCSRVKRAPGFPVLLQVVTRGPESFHQCLSPFLDPTSSPPSQQMKGRGDPHGKFPGSTALLSLFHRPNQTGPPDRRESCEPRRGRTWTEEAHGRLWQGPTLSCQHVNNSREFTQSVFNMSPEWTLFSPAPFPSGLQPIFSAS